MTDVFGDEITRKAKQFRDIDSDAARAEIDRLITATFKQTDEKFIYGLACNAHLCTKLREMSLSEKIWGVS